MVRSGTSRGSTGGTGGGKRFQYGPSLTPLPLSPYDMTEEQKSAIVKAQVDAHFGLKPAPPQGRKCLRKRLTTLFVWLEHQLPSLLTQTMSAKSGRHIEHDYKRSRARARAKQLAKNAGKPFPSWENRRRKRSPRLLCQQHMRGVVRAPNIIVGKPLAFPSMAMW